VISSDTANINLGQHNVTIRDSRGNVVFQRGEGGTEISLDRINSINVRDAEGNIVFQR